MLSAMSKPKEKHEDDESQKFADRLRIACVEVGFGSKDGNGDTPGARKMLETHLGISRMAVSKLFSGKSAGFSVGNLFKAADLLEVNPRWLGTGVGPMKAEGLPGELQALVSKLHGITNYEVRLTTIAAATAIAADPHGQLAQALHAVAEGKGRSPEARYIAEMLDARPAGRLKRIAIEMAKAAAVSPEYFDGEAWAANQEPKP